MAAREEKTKERQRPRGSLKAKERAKEKIQAQQVHNGTSLNRRGLDRGHVRPTMAGEILIASATVRENRAGWMRVERSGTIHALDMQETERRKPTTIRSTLRVPRDRSGNARPASPSTTVQGGNAAEPTKDALGYGTPIQLSSDPRDVRIR